MRLRGQEAGNVQCADSRRGKEMAAAQGPKEFGWLPFWGLVHSQTHRARAERGVKQAYLVAAGGGPSDMDGGRPRRGRIFF